jgi:hypothetical protein
MMLGLPVNDDVMIGRCAVTISQPRYLPALNYLQRICFSDVFVVFDIVQRQSRAFENRNKLLLPDARWLTIPIQSSSRALISETGIDGEAWVSTHKAQIVGGYRRAPHFDEALLDLYFSAFLANSFECSSSFSAATIRALVLLLDELKLPHNFRFARELCDETIAAAEGPAKLRRICEKLNASTYISGENGRSYGVVECFADSACKVRFHLFEPAPYAQHNHISGFIPYMGFFDALFNCGRDWFRDAVMKPPTLVS